MKKVIAFLILSIISLWNLTAQDFYKDQWTKIEEQEILGNTKTANDLVEKIAIKAKIDKNDAQSIKSLFYLSKFAMDLQEESATVIVQEIHNRIQNSDSISKFILYSILADFQSQYLQKNAYRIKDRTSVENDTANFQFWSTDNFNSEIIESYRKSISEKESLETTNIDNYSYLLNTLHEPTIHFNNIYQLLINRALNYGKSNNRYLSKNSQSFKITKDHLVSSDRFTKTDLNTSEETDKDYFTLKCYQELEKSLLKNNENQLLAYFTLDRYKYIKSKIAISESDFLKALNDLDPKFEDKLAKDLIALEKALTLKRRASKQDFPQDNINAISLSEEILKHGFNSYLKNNAQNIISDIKKKEFSVQVNPYQSPQKNFPIFISYTNLDSLQFQIYKLNKTDFNFLDKHNFYTEEQKIKLKKLLKKLNSETKEFSNWIKLPNKSQHFKRTTETIAPKLKIGKYVILLKDKSLDDLYALKTIQVSELSLISNQDENIDLKVVNRETGKPIENATVKAILHSNNNTNSYEQTSDKNGNLSFSPEVDYLRNIEYNITKDQDEIILENRYSYYRNTYENEDEERGFLFTDRSIYRPGQQIYYKGVLVSKIGDSSKVLSGKKIAIRFLDANRSEIEKRQAKTNNFGSVSGNFEIPTGLKTGQFTIQIQEESGKERPNFYATKRVSVEEYKRPKFKIAFKPITQSFASNDSVKINGYAESFSGARLSHANVTYRILRFENYGYASRYRKINPQEIDNGELQTDENGDFQIKFLAKAENSEIQDPDQIYSYNIEVSVTDINGETQSKETTVNAGSKLNILSISGNYEFYKKDGINFIPKVTNLNYEDVDLPVTVEIYKLQAPERILNFGSDLPNPDTLNISKNKYKNFLPHTAFLNEDKKSNWKNGKLWHEATATSNKKIKLKNIKKWPPGSYRIILKTKDKKGNKIVQEKIIDLKDRQTNKASDNQLFEYIIANKDFTKDGFIEISLLTAAKDLYVNLEAYIEGKAVFQQYVDLKKGAKNIEIPIKDYVGKEVSLRFSSIKYNSTFTSTERIKLKDKKPQPEIILSTFRDKIEPGSKEQWSLKIKPKNNKDQFEVLAGMYDASLDQFKEHSWPEHINIGGRYYRLPNLGFLEFSPADFSLHNRNYFYFAYEQPRLPKLDYFGFSYNNTRKENRDYLLKLLFRGKDFTTDYVSKGGIIKGKVIAISDRKPLPGITIEGSNTGTQANYDGEFDIKTKEGDQLKASFIGFQASYFIVNEDKSITILMAEDIEALNEVVTVGNSVKIRGMSSAAVEEVAMDISRDQVMGYTTQDSTAGDQKELSVKARQNLNETAFFYPNLKTDKEGNINLEFTSPEALTQWRLMLFGHNKEAESAYKEAFTVTQKELMLTPNAPRFLREKDSIVISAKISNLSDEFLKGKAQLKLFNAEDESRIDTNLSNTNAIQEFNVAENGNTQLSWKLYIPEDFNLIRYEIVAKTEEFEDGETNLLPVLKNRMLVTETIPIWLQGQEEREFSLRKNDSKTLQNHQITLEYTANPAWTVLQSLPYLIDYPYDCSEQTFSKYFAKAISEKILKENPEIAEVLKKWNENSATSNLEKNEELKSILLQETPWVNDAKSETENIQNLSKLLTTKNLQSYLLKLQNMQNGDGGFPWFKDGRSSFYITSHILGGFAYLLQNNSIELNKTSEEIIENGLGFLKNYMLEHHANKFDNNITGTRFSPNEILYLYTKTILADEFYFEEKEEDFIDKMIQNLKQNWLDLNLQTKAMLAVSFNNYYEEEEATKIVNWFKQNSIEDDKGGMYFKNNAAGKFWYHHPIETQAKIIEAFAAVNPEDKDIDKLKNWLLQHKRKNSWATTKSTTMAVNAFLSYGKNWLKESSQPEIKMNNESVKLDSIFKEKSDLGHVKKTWNDEKELQKIANFSIKNNNDAPAYGGIYHQYFEDLDKIERSKGEEIIINKALFLKENTSEGPQLKSLPEVLKVGELVTVRVTIDVKSDFKFVHLKDMRASGLEPTSVLSRHKYQDGLRYYQSKKDAATHFFFDYLPKGTYVFEYDLRVNNAGEFSNGITQIESMYAPEFSSFSKGTRIKIEN
ncbi:CarboxypepD_reg-like domain-containing protein [Zunongwangia mangrovi]|uniref:CarboxypepD_reg-like domain-containing protein n=1 Tax=Zunongwangia mangrovi TaxID=1334022 RepID=A0A1I1K958_9FLAO|nr:MG2 domain-containing protein [Zunongwangia mangrovi]SFC55228.1 CarboxypepD_reg-like domain-containing protein [Zunongwangia mangrovi]